MPSLHLPNLSLDMGVTYHYLGNKSHDRSIQLLLFSDSFFSNFLMFNIVRVHGRGRVSARAPLRGKRLKKPLRIGVPAVYDWKSHSGITVPLFFSGIVRRHSLLKCFTITSAITLNRFTIYPDIQAFTIKHASYFNFTCIHTILTFLLYLFH